MRALSARLALLLLIGIVSTARAARAQDDLYFVDSGKLLRWISSRPPVPQSLPPQTNVPSVASIAVNRRNAAYINSGLDGAIFRTDGQNASRIYLHDGQVRQLAFGKSNDVLFFSVVPTPKDKNPLADGQIYALNLTTLKAELRHTIAQSTVDEAWWGTFTVDLDDRVFVGTAKGGVYALREGKPTLAFRTESLPIQGLAAEVNDLFYTTGGPQIFRLRNLRDSQLALTLPGKALTHASYASFPLDTEKSEPCELLVGLTGGAPGLINLFFPVIGGPNLRWISRDLSGNGGSVGPGRFRYFVERGTYWVRMDSRGDVPRSPRPRERAVVCTGAQGEAAFVF